MTVRAGLAILAVVVHVFSSACTRVENIPPSDNVRIFKDDIGRSVEVPAKVDRVVSLAPSITETIFAASGGSKLVGDTTYCNYPPEAQSIAKVGDTQTPNIEAIVALKPQVVFVSTDSQLEAYLSVLDQQHIAVFVVDVRGVDEVPNAVREVGTILGTADAAGAAAEQLYQRIAAVKRESETSETDRPPNPTPRPRVFLQISNEPLFTIGRQSFLTQLIDRAGGNSVTKDLDSGYPKLSKETAVTLQPQIIILSDSEDNREPNDVFKSSSAVKNGRILKIDADILSRPGPRLVDALEQIAEYLRKSASDRK
jgi:iron complex transport system substrate-binding protein